MTWWAHTNVPATSMSAPLLPPPLKRARGRPTREERSLRDALTAHGLLGGNQPALPALPEASAEPFACASREEASVAENKADVLVANPHEE